MSLSQSGTFAADPQGSGRAVAALSLTRREGLGGLYGGDGGGRDMDDIPFFLFSSFLSPPGIVFIFYSIQLSPCW